MNFMLIIRLYIVKPVIALASLFMTHKSKVIPNVIRSFSVMRRGIPPDSLYISPKNFGINDKILNF